VTTNRPRGQLATIAIRESRASCRNCVKKCKNKCECRVAHMHQNSGARYLPRPVSASRLFPGRRCSRRTLARMFFRSAASGNLQGRSSAFPPALQKARPPVDDRPHHHELRFDAADPAIGTPWPVATVIAVPRASSCHRLSIQCSDMNGSGVLSIVVRRTLASACGDSSLVFHRATFDVKRRSRPVVAIAAFITCSTLPLPMNGSILPCARHS
jgi:hypothetical protein